MIKKRIFYVWGADEPLKDSVKKCIESWRKFLPDYEIIQVDEKCRQYFDYEKELHNNRWFRVVYERKLWAFVADYIRIKVLYDHGGVYLDTDVEVLQSFDKFLHEPAFVGMQSEQYTEPAILGSEPQNQLFKNILDFYDEEIWHKEIYSIPQIFKYFIDMEGQGEIVFPKKEKQEIVKLKNITIYPERFFIPFRYTEEYSDSCITRDTHSIHWWGKSWVKPDIMYFLENKHKLSLADIDKSYEANKFKIDLYYRAKFLWAEKLKQNIDNNRNIEYDNSDSLKS